MLRTQSDRYRPTKYVKLFINLRQAFESGRTTGQKDTGYVHAFNDIMFSILFPSIIAAGGIFARSNPGYTPFELAYHFRTSDTKFIITEPEMLESIVAAAKDCGIPPSNIFIFNPLSRLPYTSGFRVVEDISRSRGRRLGAL